VPGRTVKAVTTDEGRLLSLKYTAPDGQELFAQRQGEDKLAIARHPLSLQPRLAMGSGVIKNSLFQAIDEAGLDEEIAIQIAEILSGEIDFHRDLQPGDRFSVVYEALYHGAEFVRAGRVVGVEFVNSGRSVRAVSFANGNGQITFYSEDGKNLRKTFLRSPIEFSRITSGFTSARFHPVLATWRAHRGVDYGAPQGTRVRATADGVVRLAGKMSGYGNVVVLHHPNGYQTLYGHLSGFAKDLRAGAHVSQSDVIGFVGMTGLATGPHLHYELRVNGTHRDPLKIATPPAPGISATTRPEFIAATRPLLERLDLIRGANIAALQ
jgi:murein DD-endopeptidase MepM/ murein hydrolase activator NlpD